MQWARSPDGDAFVIMDQPAFAKEVLPRFYKHNKLSSFPAGVCEGALPGAYNNSGGCEQDWPNQAFDTCCLSNNNFKCPAGSKAAPACLKNCGAKCE